MTTQEQKDFIEQQRNDLKTKMQELRTDFQNKSKQFFADATRSLFKRYPELECFAWTQSQEYNDEGYKFYARVDGDCLEINGFREPQGTRGSYQIQKDIRKFKESPTVPTAVVQALEEEHASALIIEDRHDELARAVSDVLNCFSSDDYETMFGSGYKITVSNTGDVDIESYDYGY